MDQVSLIDIHLEIACGNEQAAKFCQVVGKLMRLADNIVDGDSEDPSSDMAELLYRAFVDLQLNDFYMQHKEIFLATAGNDILLWDVSNEWQASEDKKQQIFGFVYRMAVNTFLTVAMITGGMAHAKQMIRKIYNFHQMRDHKEQLEDWVGELQESRKKEA